MPNVTGTIGLCSDGIGWFGWNGRFFSNGCFSTTNNELRGYMFNSGEGLVNSAYLNPNRSSNQYQSINEVRVKSIISNGFIKLY